MDGCRNSLCRFYSSNIFSMLLRDLRLGIWGSEIFLWELYLVLVKFLVISCGNKLFFICK